MYIYIIRKFLCLISTGTFTRLIIALASPYEDEIPTTERKSKLKANGLGEKEVTFDVDGDSEHVLEKLLR